jgi:hypothetical protein
MKGRTVLFTGASRGMGRFVAIELARRGANILVVGTKSRAARQRSRRICAQSCTPACGTGRDGRDRRRVQPVPDQLNACSQIGVFGPLQSPILDQPKDQPHRFPRPQPSPTLLRSAQGLGRLTTNALALNASKKPVNWQTQAAPRSNDVERRSVEDVDQSSSL